MKLYPVIGIEIHVQLNTRTKLFCSCLNEYTPDQPNKNICPFCTGQPGALPVLNKSAVEKAIRFGVAVGAKIPAKSRWDRKNYFYPDLPAGYQISQYDNPIVEGGQITFYVEDKNTGEFERSKINLTRAHLEADAAKLLHAGGKTLVDFNRSCAPLIEIVTEPELHSSGQAMAFVNELQLIARRIGISDADMDKGQMRFDCNISLRTEEQQTSGQLPSYKVEVKNINSVRALGRAVEFEIKRQTELLENGETPKQETRGWRDDLNRSDSQRSKEEAHDYRYFPEPDLQILEITTGDIPHFNELPELPQPRRERYLGLGLNLQTANTFVTQPGVGDYFDQVVSVLTSGETAENPDLIKTNANILSVNVIALAEKTQLEINQIVTPVQLVELAKLFKEEKINNQGVAKTLEIIGQNPDKQVLEVVESEGLLQVSDDTTLLAVVDVVIQNNPKVAEEYKAGKTQVIGFLVGLCMKESQGKGNPKKFSQLLQNRLSA
jgi:aspartyl-tRNA(Asn)/glutamyl-tRNA(Gln) amidotransferase subunit B